MWKLNITLLNNKSKKKSQGKSYNILTSENENTTYQTLWDAVKVVIREKFTAIDVYIKKEDLKSTT